MIEAWEQRKKELDEQEPELRQVIAGDVQEWDPSKPKPDLVAEQEAASQQQSTKDLVPVADDEDGQLSAALSAIEDREQEYLREYYLIVEKDKVAGKDFNKVAHDEMVRAQLDFAQMRKFEQERHEQALRQKRIQEGKVGEKTLTVPPTSDSKSDMANQSQQIKETSTIENAEKRSDIIQRHLNRSGLTRKNMESKRQVGQRYAMFEEAFGDVFEKIYQEKQQEEIKDQSASYSEFDDNDQKTERESKL